MKETIFDFVVTFVYFQTIVLMRFSLSIKREKSAAKRRSGTEETSVLVFGFYETE